MAMGEGYWLNPRTDQSWVVTRHELWILKPENAKLIGIPDEEFARLQSLNPVRDVDEIRMAGIKAGLVRIRSHQNRISVQFSAPAHYVREILWSVLMFLDKIEQYKDTPLNIENLQLNDYTNLSLKDLGLRLKADQNVMKQEEVQPIEDIKLTDKLRSIFKLD